jgi:hypothetical protein
MLNVDQIVPIHGDLEYLPKKPLLRWRRIARLLSLGPRP